MFLCLKCGEKHEHPCLIYKTPFISSLGETYNFIDKNYLFTTNKVLKKNQRNVIIKLLGDKDISLRPIRGYLIPIKIVDYIDYFRMNLN